MANQQACRRVPPTGLRFGQNGWQPPPLEQITGLPDRPALFSAPGPSTGRHRRVPGGRCARQQVLGIRIGRSGTRLCANYADSAEPAESNLIGRLALTSSLRTGSSEPSDRRGLKTNVAGRSASHFLGRIHAQLAPSPRQSANNWEIVPQLAEKLPDFQTCVRLKP